MYFISCIFIKSEMDVNEIDVDEKDIRTFGFFNDYETCVLALHNNWVDMHECYYQYAVVEEVNEGIHPKVESYYWFKWDKKRKGFYECEDQMHEIHKCRYGYALG